MKLAFLCWLLSAALALFALAASTITFHPRVEYLGRWLPILFAAGAVLAAAAALVLGRFSSPLGSREIPPSTIRTDADTDAGSRREGNH